MSARIAVDTGGTFTDVVLTDESGALWEAKASTTPEDVFVGVSNAIERAALLAGTTLDDLLSRCSLLSYATTHATNAILTRRTARTAFVTTHGHPDTLVLKEGGKFGPFDLTQPYPEPYVPRALTFEVMERVSAEGSVIQPFDEADALRVIDELRSAQVEAVGVCFLWAHIRPDHEMRFGEMLAEHLPEVAVSLSHETVPIIREYRRASATCIDASLKPLMTQHFNSVATRLAEHGFRGDLLIVTSTGGAVPVADVVQRPLLVVSSGPSIAPVGAQAAATDEGITADLVIGDMGGTTFDISSVRNGEVQFARETWLGAQFTGDITGLSSVSVDSIGYGGGSIAWIDDGGLLRVGPASAGASPGPACYGRGGTKPTFTDAAVVSGFIDPEMFLAGAMALDGQAAYDAIRIGVAEPLGMDVHDAAAAVMEVAIDGMAEETRELMAREGIDPSDAVFVAGGGASGLCAGEISMRLGCQALLIPRTAPVLSAAGGLYSDVVMEFTASHATDTDRFDFEGVEATLAELDEQMEQFLQNLRVEAQDRSRQFIVEARYRHQVWELEMPLGDLRPREASDLPQLQEAFHETHERVFGVRDSGQPVECLYWRGRARAALQAPQTVAVMAEGASEGRPGTAFFQGYGLVETPRYVGDGIDPGAVVSGPAIVDLPHSTVVVPTGMSATRTAAGHFVITQTDQKAYA